MEAINRGVFEPTAAMLEDRSYHSETGLLNGEVLVAGGNHAAMGNNSGSPQPARFDSIAPGWPEAGNLLYRSGVERYDPNKQKWSAAAPLLRARAFHEAVRLRSGSVMVVAGSDGNTLRSVELYDVAKDLWTAASDLMTPRFAHTATLLDSGKVLVVGGNNLQQGGGQVLDSVESYDPASGKWTLITWLPVARMDHTATLLTTGKVLVVGGYSGKENAALASAFTFDPALNTWTEINPLPAPRMLHTATLLDDGRVLVIGGTGEPFGSALASAEIYDPRDGTWRSAKALNVGRKGHSATKLSEGQVLVAGSAALFDPGESWTAERYDPVSDEWTVTGDLVTGRYGHSASLLASGRVLIAGGQRATPDPAFLNSAELFAERS
jgi:hypothetical protein